MRQAGIPVGRPVQVGRVRVRDAGPCVPDGRHQLSGLRRPAAPFDAYSVQRPPGGDGCVRHADWSLNDARLRQVLHSWSLRRLHAIRMVRCL